MSVKENEEKSGQEESKISKKKIQLSLPLIFFGVAFLLVFLSITILIIPKYNETEETKIKITEEDTSVKLLEQQITSLKNKEKEILEKEKQKAEEDNKKIIIPAEFSITALLETIDFYTHESKGYTLNQITIGDLVPLVDTPAVSEILIGFQIKCTPEKLIELISNLEEDSQIFLIDSFNLNNETRILNEETSNELKMKTYYMSKI